MISHLLDYASVDIKMAEHFSDNLGSNTTESDISGPGDVIEREIQVINILISRGVDTYCKVVVMPTTGADYMGALAKRSLKALMNRKNFQWLYSHAVPLSSGLNTLLACWKCPRKPESIWMFT